MSSPIYTATGSPTVGSADPQAASTRAKIYSTLQLITPLLGLAATFGLLSQDQVGAVNGAIAAGTTLLGAFGLFGFNLAARNTKQQLENRVFEPAPELPAVSALEQLKILRDQASHEVNANVAAVQAAGDVIQSTATAVAKSLGVPGVVTDVSNGAFDALQQLINRQGGG